MRILQIGKFFPPPFGGIEAVSMAMMREMNKNETRMDLVVAGRSLESKTHEYAQGRVFELPSLGQLNSQPLTISLIPWLRRAMSSLSYDLVHIHLPNPLGDVALQLSGCKAPIVVTWHSDIVKQVVSRNLYQPILDRLLERAAAITAPTPKHFSSSQQLRGRWSSKWAYVPFGFDPPESDNSGHALAQVRAWRREIGAEVIVLAVGRHVGYKGFEYLVRAAVDLPSSCHVVIVGDGPLRKGLMRLAGELRVASRVHFPGAVSSDYLSAALEGCDVFCLPSISQAEAFGIVCAEAMLHSKPVVCCELENGVTYLNRNGETSIVGPPRSVEFLVEALLKLAGDSALRRRMGEQGKRWISSEYSVAAMRQRLLEVYETVLRSGVWSRGLPTSVTGAQSSS